MSGDVEAVEEVAVVEVEVVDAVVRSGSRLKNFLSGRSVDAWRSLFAEAGIFELQFTQNGKE